MTSRRPGLSTVNPATGEPWTLKDAVAAVMPEAKAAAGAIVDCRTLYYKVRPRIQKLIGIDRELDYKYYATKLLPEYQRNDTTGVLEGLYFDARGWLVLPHSDEVIQLGTRQVEAFEIPQYHFDKILVIEKTGLDEQLAPFQLGQRFDMAIIYGKGYAVKACRDLLARMDARDIDIFVLHDADLDGYKIARTLGEATKRMPNHSVRIIDLGLTVPQAISRGLETEAVTRKIALPHNLVLDDAASEWFTGTPFLNPQGKTWYHATRCELNAFSADELAAFIEEQLALHGMVPKLVPPPVVLDGFVKETRDDHIDTLIWNYLQERIDFAEVVTEVKQRHPEVVGSIDEERVRVWFDATARNNTKPWRTAVEQLVDEDIEAVTEVNETVKELIIEQLNGV